MGMEYRIRDIISVSFMIGFAVAVCLCHFFGGDNNESKLETKIVDRILSSSIVMPLPL